MSVAALTLRFLNRELRNRFAGSFSGGLWALIQPLVQLAVYSFVYVRIFKAQLSGADAPGYVAFLAAALWPWTAFSEACVQENAALIGKVALPREVLVLARVASSFVVHLAGFIAILIVLAVAGQGIALSGLPSAVLLFAPLFVLTLGIALIFSAVQVFVRDLAQALPQLLQLLMFAAPIFYERRLLPVDAQGWLDLNPFSFYAESFRSVLLHYGTIDSMRLLVAIITATITLLIGHWVFRRLDPHFEDFL
jgi:lipopolysaccharide transport system permease protein